MHNINNNADFYVKSLFNHQLSNSKNVSKVTKKCSRVSVIYWCLGYLNNCEKLNE